MPISKDEQQALDALAKQLKDKGGFKEDEISSYLDSYKKAREAADSSTSGLDPDSIDAINKLSKAMLDVSRQLPLMLNAFRSGDTVTGTAGVMDICATASGFFGGLQKSGALSSAGAIFGALFGLIALILRACSPPPKSTSEVLEKIARTTFGEEKEISLTAKINLLDEAYSYIADKAEKKQVLSKDDFDKKCPLGEPDNQEAIFLSSGWLAMEGNQKAANKEWHAVLEANLFAGTLELRNFLLAFSILDPQAFSSNYAAFLTRVENRLTQLNDLEGVIRGKSLLWCLEIPNGFFKIGHGGRLYVRRLEQTSWTGELGGEARTFTVAIPARGDTSVVFALEGKRERTSIADAFPHHERTYARTVGLDFDGADWTQIPALNGLRDIHAMPDDDDPARVRLYWASDGGSGYSTYSPDEPDKVTTVQNIPRSGVAIRAVPGRGADFYYVLHQSWPNPWDAAYAFWYANQSSFNFPFKECQGIAACSTFLWAYHDRDIAYVSHDEASRAHGNAPWRELRVESGQNGVPPVNDDYPFQFMKWLSPCDDRMLIAVFNLDVYTTTWEMDKDGTLVIAPWKPLENGPVTGTTRIHRQLIKAWPLYTSRRAALERIHSREPQPALSR